MQLVIAEKPSVAQSIAKVLGANDRSNGYLEGNGYLISWCFGHLAGLADADYYDQRYTKWTKDDLPIVPSSFRFRLADDKRDQFDVLKSLMDREDVTCVINACDAGREGELIFRTVYYLAECSKPMKRLWISSMEDEAIREGFNHLRPGSEFDGLHQSALCRAKADWLVGINATRFFSLLYGTKLNIGRVMSPTLALLVQRESEIGAFIPESYYTVNLEYSSFIAASEKFPDKQKADALASACKNDDAIIQIADTIEKTEKAPALYDLTTLQRDANRMLGYTAQQTLDYLQALYEKKLCTYPRTDSRFLSDDMENSVKSIALCAAGICGMDVPGTVLSHLVCNSKKVSDHHAIIPTIVAGEYDLSALPKGEQEIIKLISRQVLIAVSDVYRYQETSIIILCGGDEFTANLKLPLDIGWKQYSQQEITQKRCDGLTVGMTLNPNSISVKKGTTKPPRHYTEDLLLASMETAGAKEMPDEAERKGLGTPATRASILEKLVATGMVERKKSKKQTNLIPTALGNALITVLPEQLQSPMLTAEWEHGLSLIQHDELEPEVFMDGIVTMLQELIRGYEVVPGADILFPSDKEAIGKCPRCGNPVTENKHGFFCENKDCQFALWKSNRFFAAKNKVLTKKIASALLEDGRAFLKDCYSPKTGATYDATVILMDDGQRTNFRLDFGNG